MKWICSFLLGTLAVVVPGTSQRTVTPVPDSASIRGHAQTLHIYGARGAGVPIIVSSGDGGWVHLAPHVAEVLASRGYFVVGFDVKAYLESFTSGAATLRVQDEPGDYRVLVNYA